MSKTTQLGDLNLVGRKQPATQTPDQALDGAARWRIDFHLTTQGLLHLGSGEDRQLNEGEIPDDPDRPAAEAPFAAMLVRDAHGRPHWPGASLKGVLRQRALDAGADPQWLTRVFGCTREPTKDDKRSTLSGGAEFRAARWRCGSDVTLEVRTAIDRRTLTVAERKLFHQEVVPPATQFDASIVLPWAAAADVAVLRQLLTDCSQDKPLRIGAHTRSGWGAVGVDKVQVHKTTRQSLQAWWDAPLGTDGATRAWQDALAKGEAGLPQTPSSAGPGTALTLKLQLQFEGPFAARDPAHRKAPGDSKPNSVPRERDGKPLLPATSFLGALRSRAEQILRSLGSEVPQGHAAQPVRTGEHPAGDLASLLFGCAGWRGLLGATGDFIGRAGAKKMTQHMVALCRITGGGQDRAKFAFECWENPVLDGCLSFDARRFEPLKQSATGQAALGLLHLVLAELAYGDIGFGMARSKGWGWVHKDEHLLNRLAADWWSGLAVARPADTPQRPVHQDLLQALHQHCRYTPPESHSLPTMGTVQHPASPAAEVGPPTLFRGPGKVGKAFHNPYNFLPFSAKLHGAGTGRTEPISAAVLAVDADRQGHSHDRYQPQRHSGRLVICLTTKTPLFIGAQREAGDGENPVPVNGFTFDGQPAIPGTSLRGMLGALIEPMSGSAMRVVDAEQMLSVRLTTDSPDPLSEKGVIVKGEGPSGEISLRVKQFAKDGKTPNYYPIPSKVSELLYALADERWRAVGKGLKLDSQAQRAALRDQIYKERNPAIAGSGRRDSTAKGQVALLPAIDLDGKDDYCWPRNGDLDRLGSRARLMPKQVVYFRWGGPGQRAAPSAPVAELAWSQVYRRTRWVDAVPKPGPLNLSRLVQLENKNRLPLGLRPNPRLHAAEWLLGAVEKREKGSSTEAALAFASKLSFETARSTSAVVRLQPMILKELASPKPPSPALYLRRHGPVKGIVSKVELLKQPKYFAFHGTKVYLHALRDGPAAAKLSELGTVDGTDGKDPWVTQRPPVAPSQSKENKDYHLSNRQAKIEPIAANQSFRFTIRFTNLSIEELALLCAAVHPSADFEHRLGMGRPIGLGSIKLSFKDLKIIDRVQRLIDGSEALVCLDPLNLAAQGMATLKNEAVDPGLCAALLVVGEPGRVQHPVHYPQVTPGTMPRKEKDGTQPPPMKGRIENLNYQWWMENDRDGGPHQSLQGLDKSACTGAPPHDATKP